ncbi:MAG: ABC transporter substrate-binding protein [Deltaproteobacteria bacterium]|nr:ABC transporter substrate-binding protein [Deltaproteobacteria bacterium]
MRRAATSQAVALALALGSVGGACSLALDFEDECAVDGDCAPLGRGLRCDAGFCVPKDLVEVAGPCNRLYGEDPRTAEPGSVIMLGTLLPRSGALGAFGDGMDNGVRLAVDEINQSGGVLGKKLGVLSCDDGTDVTQAEAAARHLVDVARVDAIIGSGASSVTIETFNRVAKADRVLMISPSATSPAISNLPDEGLLWRTVPSDAIQGRAIAEYILHKGYDVVAVVNRNDAYGNGLAAAIQTRLCTSGGFSCTTDTFLSRLYSAEDGSAQQLDDQTQAVTFLADNAPDAVVLIGYVPDGISLLNFARDKGFSFILTDGMRDTDLLGTDPAQVGVQDQKILCSLVGTNPASPSGGLFDQFALKYDRNFQQAPGTFVANAYDAAYLVAFGYAAAKGAGISDPDGRALAEGLTRVSHKGATAVTIGLEGFGTGVGTLSGSATSTIDVVGISGPLDFDAALGEAPSGIEMWRLDLGRQEISNLGVVYDGQDLYTFGGIGPRPAEDVCNQ